MADNELPAHLQEQCFLLNNIETIQWVGQQGSRHNITGTRPSIGRYTARLRYPGDQTAVDNSISMIHHTIDKAKFLDLGPYEYAHLIPVIELFKHTPDNGSGNRDGKDIPITFENNLSNNDVSLILTDQATNPRGVNIKSLEWHQLGGNTAEVDSNIDLSIKLHLQNTSDLFVTRTATLDNGETEEYKYADLITPALRDATAKDPGYFRVRMRLGWTTSPTEPPNWNSTIFPSFEDFKKVIEKNRTVLFLTLYQHAISFQQDGSVELQIKYIAALDSGTPGPNANLIYDPETSAEFA